MPEQTPWFLILKSGDENLPGSPWRRRGGNSRGKVVALPVWPMGWVVLIGFITSLTASILVVWLVLVVGFNVVNVTAAAVLTVVMVVAEVFALIFLIKNTSAHWTPELAARLRDKKF